LHPNDQLPRTALPQITIKDGKTAEAEAARANVTILAIGGKVRKE